jgi:hypothetical protein
MTQRQRRWTWWQQTLDAMCALAGLVLLGFMVKRNDFDPLGVILVLALAGRVSMASLERWLTGRGDK